MEKEDCAHTNSCISGSLGGPEASGAGLLLAMPNGLKHSGEAFRGMWIWVLGWGKVSHSEGWPRRSYPTPLSL